MREIILNVKEIRKCNTSYGDYCFDVVIKRRNYQGNWYLQTKTIFEYGLKDINKRRLESIKEVIK